MSVDDLRATRWVLAQLQHHDRQRQRVQLGRARGSRRRFEAPSDREANASDALIRSGGLADELLRAAAPPVPTIWLHRSRQSRVNRSGRGATGGSPASLLPSAAAGGMGLFFPSPHPSASSAEASTGKQKRPRSAGASPTPYAPPLTLPPPARGQMLPPARDGARSD